MNIELLKNLVDYGVVVLLVFMSFLSFWFLLKEYFFIKILILKFINQKNH